MLNATINPAFAPPFYGLELLDDNSKREFAKMIANFKEIVPNQPSFLIKKESWNMLAEGKHPDGSDWKNSNLEVYGFVFCIAFDQRAIVASKLGKLKLGKSKHATPTAYFRIRTLLKDRNAKIEDGVPISVETERIAYVSLENAIYNQNNPNKEQKDCLVFNKEANSALRVRIDNDVIVHPSSVTERNPYNPNIPLGFQNPEIGLPKPNSIIKNEGTIFGKQGIWDALLSFSGLYKFQKDTLISLACDDDKKNITFNFKINDEYGVTLPCPNPPICNLE